MDYMILIHSDETFEMPAEGTPEFGEMMGQWMAYNQTLIDGGHWIAGASLMPTMTATTVRKSFDGAPTTTDGPFAETKDLIAGWMIIDVDSEARAIELAGELSSAPGANGEPIHEWLEVRPFLTAPPTITD